MSDRKQWFIDRIGKRIYRDLDTCGCKHCADVVANGLVIHDEFHAGYLADVEAAAESEEVHLNYRDTLEGGDGGL